MSSNEFQDATVALSVVRKVLDVAHTFEAQEKFPQYDHFANLFKQRYFEEALNEAAMDTVVDALDSVGVPLEPDTFISIGSRLCGSWTKRRATILR
ncbi:uncharacterized protein BT62DRAFT_1006044 [Guyanagaster necrorhizus]|uniref:Uncharacterized protein n=1 Tax=Guyanagaster necrorhizus TaxID=856835 RepID=A0A9P7VTM3_9AGAR|nr:uncharacterized protein BT62DRAFT_1006044 [Guyanagaster necrorhizus MCA 3950]KAG7445859.1 hypothetical protein BT62DRAFT_1006044 [Guyanagaster necrorhizus MCA 3950]